MTEHRGEGLIDGKYSDAFRSPQVLRHNTSRRVFRDGLGILIVIDASGAQCPPMGGAARVGEAFANRQLRGCVGGALALLKQ